MKYIFTLPDGTKVTFKLDYERTQIKPGGLEALKLLQKNGTNALDNEICNGVIHQWSLGFTPETIEQVTALMQKMQGTETLPFVESGKISFTNLLWVVDIFNDYQLPRVLCLLVATAIIHKLLLKSDRKWDMYLKGIEDTILRNKGKDGSWDSSYLCRAFAMQLAILDGIMGCTFEEIEEGQNITHRSLIFIIMKKLKITLPDGTIIICEFSYGRVQLNDNDILVLQSAWPDRYNKEVLTKESYHWTMSLGKDAYEQFKRLFNAKNEEYVPLLHGHIDHRGDIDFGNIYAVIDNINDPAVPLLLSAIIIFVLCARLLGEKDHMDYFLAVVTLQLIDCITKDGYWDTDRIRRIWTIHNYYFLHVLKCRFEELNDGCLSSLKHMPRFIRGFFYVKKECAGVIFKILT